MKYDVTAESYNKVTNLPDGPRRTETICTETNGRFFHCKCAKDVAEQYESFWTMDEHSESIVKVHKVEAVKGHKYVRKD